MAARWAQLSARPSLIIEAGRRANNPTPFEAGRLVLVPSVEEAFLLTTCAVSRTATASAGSPLQQSRGASPGQPQSMEGHVEVISPTGRTTISRREVVEADPLAVEGVADLAQLNVLHEATVLHALCARHAKQQTFATVGNALLSVNPCDRALLDGPAFGTTLMQEYASASDAGELQRLPPHIFGLAERAYQGARCAAEVNGTPHPQAIVLGGESGAGKTEARRQALRYLVWRTSAERPLGEGRVELAEARALELHLVHPLIEAFGNAQTATCADSSRFGSWLTLRLTDEGIFEGAEMQTFLLESSRLLKRPRGERNFHAFYQLIAGAGEGERAALHLPTPEVEARFLMLAAPGMGASQPAATIGTRSVDAAAFKRTRAAMDALQLASSQQAAVWRALAAVLHLGNVEIVAVPGEMQSCKIGGGPGSGEALQVAASLLWLPPEFLAEALCTCAVGGPDGVQLQRLPRWADGARRARDALIRAVHGALFRGILRRVNACLGGGGGAEADHLVWLGVLDPSGFADLESNGLHQLLTNYANEALEALFTSRLLEIEERECSKDGIRSAGVEIARDVGMEDNLDVDAIQSAATDGALRALEAVPGGILEVIDEESAAWDGTDSALVLKVLDGHGGKGVVREALHGCFLVVHFGNGSSPQTKTAQHVLYNAAGFVEGNRDAIPHELLSLLSCSGEGWLRAAFTERMCAEQRKLQARRHESVCSQLSRTLGRLHAQLEAAEMHIVRCIKPNRDQRARRFVGPLVLQQLRTMGVVQAIALRRHGWEVRLEHHLFYQRYSVLVAPDSTSGACGHTKNGTVGSVLVGGDTVDRAALQRLLGALMEQEYLRPDAYALGRSKVFLSGSAAEELVAAQRRKRRKLSRAALEVAMQAATPVALQVALAGGCGAGLPSAELLAAKAELSRLRATVELRGGLRRLLQLGVEAGGSPEEAALESALQRGTECGADAAVLAKADTLLQAVRSRPNLLERLRAAAHACATVESAIAATLTKAAPSSGLPARLALGDRVQQEAEGRLQAAVAAEVEASAALQLAEALPSSLAVPPSLLRLARSSAQQLCQQREALQPRLERSMALQSQPRPPPKSPPAPKAAQPLPHALARGSPKPPPPLQPPPPSYSPKLAKPPPPPNPPSSPQSVTSPSATSPPVPLPPVPSPAAGPTEPRPPPPLEPPTSAYAKHPRRPSPPSYPPPAADQQSSPLSQQPSLLRGPPPDRKAAVDGAEKEAAVRQAAEAEAELQATTLRNESVRVAIEREAAQLRQAAAEQSPKPAVELGKDLRGGLGGGASAQVEEEAAWDHRDVFGSQASSCGSDSPSCPLSPRDRAASKKASAAATSDAAQLTTRPGELPSLAALRSNIHARMSSETYVPMQGPLKKRGGGSRVTTWHWRFCILHEHALSIYQAAEKATRLRSSLPLQSVMHIRPAERWECGGREFAFSLLTGGQPLKGGRTYVFCCSSAEEVTQWMTSLLVNTSQAALLRQRFGPSA